MPMLLTVQQGIMQIVIFVEDKPIPTELRDKEKKIAEEIKLQGKEAGKRKITLILISFLT